VPQESPFVLPPPPAPNPFTEVPQPQPVHKNKTSEIKDKSIPIDQVKEWIRGGCGYKGGIPEAAEDVWALYNRLSKGRKPTSGQLNFLDRLGYKGKKPKTMYEASELIDRQKQNPDYTELSPGERRKEWIEERREEFKEQIEYDVKNESMDYWGEDVSGDNDNQLVGWKFDIDEDVDCHHRKDLQKLLYLAQIQTSDIVAHLPPFDECLVGCEGCQLESVILEGIPIRKNKAHIDFVQWESPKLRAKVPKHIFKVF
jgi:hypothetical protein